MCNTSFSCDFEWKNTFIALFVYKYHRKRSPIAEINGIIQGHLQGQKVNFRVK